MESLRGPQQYRPFATAAGGTTDYECTVPAGGTLTVSGTAQGPSGTLSLAWAAAGGAAVDSQSQAKAQSVAADAVPAVFSRAAAATVSCTADGTLTLTAAAGVHKRSVTVAVACGAVPPAVACDDPLGALPEGVTVRSGTVTADADCITAHRGRSGTYYTRRHTFSLDAAAQVTVELGSAASNRSRLDTYLILLEGHTGDSDATVTASNDDKDSSSTDSRIAEKLPAGDYTIEATAWGPSRTGGYKLTVDAEHDKHVKISGLAGTAKAGTGTVAVTAAFTVAPAAAKCTAMPATATITDGVGAADRSVSADIAAPGSLAVTVNCTASGHTASSQTVTLTAKLTAGVTTIGVRALDGGECDTAESVPDGAGRPVFCKEVSPILFPDPGDRVAKCMELHKLAVLTWNSGFDIGEYQIEKSRIVPAKMRSDLEAIQLAVDYKETILVGTGKYSRITGITAVDDVFVQLLCEGVVEFGVDKGVDAATKKVGGWAKNRFPTGTVLKGAVRLSVVLGFAQTVLGVLWQNFATDAACD